MKETSDLLKLENKPFQFIRGLVINDTESVLLALQDTKDIGFCSLIDIKSGMTISHIAAGYGQLALLTLLYNKGFNINKLTKDGYHPLHYVVLYNDHWNVVIQSIVLFFLKQDPKLINVQKIDGYTPLHIAADNNNIEFVIELIKLGAHYKIQDCNGVTPFDILKDEYYPDLEYNENMTKEEAINILEGLLASDNSPEKPQETVEEEADPSEALYVAVHVQQQRGDTSSEISVSDASDTQTYGVTEELSSVKTNTAKYDVPSNIELQSGMSNPDDQDFAKDIGGAKPALSTAYKDMIFFLTAHQKTLQTWQVNHLCKIASDDYLYKESAYALEKTKEPISHNKACIELINKINGLQHKEVEFNKLLDKLSLNELNYKDAQGMTIIMHTAYNRFDYGVERLISNDKINLEAFDNEGKDMLYYITFIPRTKYIKLLLQHPQIDVNHQDKNNKTILHHMFENAGRFLWTEELEDSKDASGNIYIGSSDMGTTNIWGGGLTCNTLTIGGSRGDGYDAATHKFLTVVAMFVNNGCNINAQDNQGITPFYKACIEMNKYLAKKLLDDYQIDLTLLTQDGNNGLAWVLEFRDIEIAQRVFDICKDIDINHRDNKGNTCLHWMCQYGWHDMVEYLLQNNAQHDIANDSGLHPIHVAAYNLHLAVIKTLLEHNVNLNIATTADNRNALHYVMYSNDANVQKKCLLIEYLLQNGITRHDEIDIKTAQQYCPQAIELLSPDHFASRSLEEIEGAYNQLLGDTASSAY